MSAVQRSVDVEVAVEDFYRVIADYPRYCEFLTGMRGVEVGRRSGNAVEVTYTLEIDAGIARKSIRYTLEHAESPPAELRWKLVRGEVMKSNEGSWSLQSLAPGRTRATYTIEIGFGLLVPKAVSNYLTDRNLPRMLGEFKARSEKLHPPR
jgi:ribosome-associated toxin RatA of RatAB toxin-antitoxin module